jgi:hypothetical protein
MVHGPLATMYWRGSPWAFGHGSETYDIWIKIMRVWIWHDLTDLLLRKTLVFSIFIVHDFPANNYFYLRVLVPLVYLLGAWVHDTALVLDGSIRSEHLYPLGISLTTFKGLWARIENSVAHRIVGHVEDSTITLFGSALQWDWVWNFGSRMGYNGDMIVGCHHISRILRRWWKKNDLWENACKSSGVSLFNHTSD